MKTNIPKNMTDIDEHDDIILPNSIFGEIIYIYYIVKDISSSKKNRKQKWNGLKRQVYFFWRWMKNK